ncbi:von Willebrand factor D and EGF domain-containing protein-like [Watersipora subatra]|uniref:von Willebrand factor D and EGF domain-containing protein-like n=1 Tax=Watersipora subatra TaxID=2589382 RepID=UPI00355B3CFB
MASYMAFVYCVSLLSLIASQTGRSDETLTKNWYKFTSGAGGEIPTSVPNAGQCNSRKPVWLNGTQPPLDGNIHTLNLCYSLSAYDPCGISLQIRGKHCLHGIVYELLPTTSANSSQVITGASYCAGTEKLCPIGMSSKTGFTPNCYVAPTVSKQPFLDLIPTKDSFRFECILGNVEPQALYKVTWKLGYDTIHEEELQFGAKTSVLQENMLSLPRQTVLGKNLTCAARGRYIKEPKDHWGAPLASDPFFVGIEVSDASGLPLYLQSNTLVLPESEDNQIIDIRSTIPVRCDPLTTRLTGKDCKIVIAIRNDNSMDHKPLRCNKGVVEQLKLATCSVTLTPDNWYMGQSISIRATKDFKYDGERERVIEFNMTEGPGRSIWDGYVPHPIQVRSFYKKCSARSTVTCNCAVAARAGDDVIIVDRCNSMGDIKIFGPDKKVEYNLLRTRTISTDDIISPNFRIYAVNGGREYHIYFPHGAMVKAQLTGGGFAQFMNLWITPSPADFNRTTGMCGTFNGDKSEDLRMRDGSVYTGPGAGFGQQPKDFSKHWRVGVDESIYNGQVPAHSTTYKKQYCSCVKPQGPAPAEEYLDCQMNSDAQRCDQRGEDITNKNFEYSAGVPKNAKAFEFDPNFDPPTPTWPTPSGWTKANATKFCEDFLTKSKAFQACNDTLTIDEDVDMCVEDIKLSDGVEFAMAALAAFKEKCLTELSKYPDTPLPMDAFCINECSGNGDCIDGECVCFTDYAAEDCSLKKSDIPNVYFTPPCDVATEACDIAEVYGDGFVKSTDLICTFQPVEVSEGKLKLTGRETEVQASYENFAQVRCPVGRARSKRDAKTPPAGQQAVSVSNIKGARSSNHIVYTQYNSLCQLCDMTTYKCTVRANMCLIEGFCYNTGDKSPESEKGTQGACDPNKSQFAWQYPEDTGLPTWAIGVIAAGGTLTLMTSALVLYKTVCRSRAKVVA